MHHYCRRSSVVFCLLRDVAFFTDTVVEEDEAVSPHRIFFAYFGAGFFFGLLRGVASFTDTVVEEYEAVSPKRMSSTRIMSVSYGM
jgi:hypothetical protein